MQGFVGVRACVASTSHSTLPVSLPKTPHASMDFSAGAHSGGRSSCAWHRERPPVAVAAGVSNRSAASGSVPPAEQHCKVERVLR